MIISLNKLSKERKKQLANLYIIYLEEILKKKIKKKEINTNLIFKKANFYVLIYYSSIASFFSVYKNLTSKNIYIRDFYTIPKFRKKGLSRKMLIHIKLLANKIKANKICINVLQSNRKIIPYWKNLSFKKKSNHYEYILYDSN